MPEILFHADDFGITPEQSRRILACSGRCGGQGALNSLSVLANSPRFAECADLLDEWLEAIHVGLHLNIVEGRCCAAPQDIPLLVDDRGFFSAGFARLLLTSALPGERQVELRRQIALELGAQIDRFLKRFPTLRRHLRLDSHQHFHMIPVVFAALSDALAARDCAVEYLRIPAEPIRPFLAAPRSFAAIPPVNWVKNLLLNALWLINKKSPPAHIAGGPPAVFCGLNFSGRMTSVNFGRIRPTFTRHAAAQGRSLEILFHPGGVPSPQDCLDPRKTAFVDFYTSSSREAEARAVKG